MLAVANGRPRWRAPALLTHPPLFFSHTGWRELASNALDDLATDAAWRSAVENEARLVSQSNDGRMLCLVSWHGLFELWDVAEDRVLYSDSPPPTNRLAAVPGGCIVHTADGRARLIRADATSAMLAEHATAVGHGPDEILVASDGQVATFTFSGEPLGTFDTGVEQRALARVHDRMVVGLSSGSLLVYEPQDRTRPPLGMRGTPPSPVTRIAAGPTGTVAAGFANGEVAMWDLATGAVLLNARLHGAIIHLVAGPSGLVAASDLGQHLMWDLAPLVQPRADLLHSIRYAVPAVWEDGQPIVRGAE